VGFLTPVIAVILVILEAFLLHFGPSRAALPFCVVFIVNQVFATIVILVQLRIITAPPGTRAAQVTTKTLLVLIVSFSVFFAAARHLLQREHNWLMALSLGLIGVVFAGLTVVLYTVVVNRNTERSDA
jgi:hypothetical protein